MSSRILVVILAIVLAAPLGAIADSTSRGFYVAVEGGITSREDTEIQDASEISFDEGVVGGLALGLAAGFLRFEVAGHYRQNDTDRLDSALASRGLDGEIGVVTALFNIWFDIENPTSLTPYLGGGGGYAWLETDDFDSLANGRFEDEDEGVAAGQLGAGVAIAVSKNFVVDLGYRFFKTEDVDISTPGGFRATVENESHIGQLGLRFVF